MSLILFTLIFKVCYNYFKGGDNIKEVIEDFKVGLKVIYERLKSPIVVLQIISIIETFLITVQPKLSTEYKALAGLMTSLISLLAGVNNPTDRDNF